MIEVFDLPELSVEVPEELMKTISEFPQVDWSAVARHAISEKVHQLAFLKYFASDSEMTEGDALTLGHKVNKVVTRRYEELM